MLLLLRFAPYMAAIGLVVFVALKLGELDATKEKLREANAQTTLANENHRKAIEYNARNAQILNEALSSEREQHQKLLDALRDADAANTELSQEISKLKRTDNETISFSQYRLPPLLLREFCAAIRNSGRHTDNSICANGMSRDEGRADTVHGTE